ncbi:MAG: trypsin-like peptidase domain-containing protein [Candidatus Doudnabacteria bacterium]|nr:trypsin-like peptidase domain-containing protein [Candidatus Doudnabacteria bacterium]
MKIKINKKTWIILCSAAAILVLGFSLKSATIKQPGNLSQEDLAKLVKPAVVRIIQHATGEVTIPAFDFDFNNLTLKILENQPALTKKIDEYLSGSGFVVGSNGYILTNSHIASPESVKNIILEDILSIALEKKTENWSEEELLRLFPSETITSEFQQNVLEMLRTNSNFNIQSQLTVLNPSESQEYLTSLIKSGFKTEVISANLNFEKDQKDIALIKINAANLPTLKLGDSSAVSVGNQIYAFGFPSTGEINQRSPLESTLTQGLISAIKFSQNKDFKIFQTDSKISEGSSGSPLFNGQGEVIGLVTFQTGEIARKKGDNFAFAVPIDLAKPTLQKYQINDSENNFSKHFKQGLILAQEKKCKKALAEFEIAAKTNGDFINPKYLENYTGKCEQIMASGQSIDNKFAEIWLWLKSISGLAWFVILGRIMLTIIAVWALYKIFIRIKQDESQIAHLELQVENQASRSERLVRELGKSGNELPLPETELHLKDRRVLMLPHPHLAEFIKEARKIGMKDQEIIDELRKAGWDEEEILHTFKTLV